MLDIAFCPPSLAPPSRCSSLRVIALGEDLIVPSVTECRRDCYPEWPCLFTMSSPFPSCTATSRSRSCSRTVSMPASLSNSTYSCSYEGCKCSWEVGSGCGVRQAANHVLQIGR